VEVQEDQVRLTALCREAAMTTLRLAMPEIDLTEDEIPYELFLSLKVTMDHFLSALAEVEPSAIREVFVEVPDVEWEAVGGLESLKRELREAVEWPFKYGDLLRHAGLKPVKGILLYGTPGTGKTLLAKAVASQGGLNFISVKGPALLSKFVGESERGIREVFKKARQASPCILFFDEIDGLAPVRSGEASDSGVSRGVMSQLLTEMDGVEELKGVLIIAATNRKDMLDPALLRPGRFDLLLELPLPDVADREAIFRIHLAGKPVAADVDAAELAAQTAGLSGADIERICQRATLLGVRDFIATYEANGSDPSAFRVARGQLLTALRER